MNIKNLKKGKSARVKQTGQIVQVKQLSDHGVALVKFRTGGEFLMLNDRLESVETVETKH